ncbi:hypothetical protein EYF80_055089 [Liparis tanakae]|uniref:Uncharacterized protein n=1 Tax=Liparis tanakae TaxID=230148 RepID=A0A4Z2F0T0_9TELE|nr:hypothetical protein EYF80_055089 [Liparis tanakae]
MNRTGGAGLQLAEWDVKHRTSDQAPVLHWAGQAARLQGLRLSGFSPLQYLLCTERLAASLRTCTQRTVRIWKPRLPQVLVQCSQSSEAHLDGDKEQGDFFLP